MKKISNKVLLLIVLCMGIGFSYLTSGLIIRGNTEVSGNSWDIYFDNIQVLEGSVSSSLPTIDTNKTKVNFAVELVKPGDYYSFTVDAVNNGTIDAMIDSIIKSNFDENTSKLFDYSVTYLDGEKIRKDDLLEAKTTTTYKVFVQYKKDISPSDLSSSDIDLNLSFEANYVMADDSINRITFGQVWNFDYSGSENIFNVPYDGEYKLEVWGAQGGTANGKIGGYGAYSVGNVILSKDETLYINVGGKGIGGGTGTYSGGYNGGGYGYGDTCGSVRYGASGGGATHIALMTGTLSTIGYSNKDKILIVSGGGGGGHNMYAAYGNGAHAGGYTGNASSWTNVSHNYTVPATGGTQTKAGTTGYGYSVVSSSNSSFGQGGNYGSNCGEGSGGGGGFYGGGAGQFSPGAGGSGYIGNALLTDKVMYCYNCSTSNEETTKTISTTNVSSNPISNYAKQDSGYAKITYLGNSNIYLTDFKKSEESVNVNNIKLNSITGEIFFETSLSNTTDYAEFSFKINNLNDENYYISKILKSNYDSEKVKYQVTYEDLENVSKNDFIRKESINKIIIKIQLLDNNIVLNNERFSITINLDKTNANKFYNRINWNYDFQGKEETFTAPFTGNYRLEVWGAQGGSYNSNYEGGYGGYSTGIITLNKDNILYINVGGVGSYNLNIATVAGGYNGGGAGYDGQKARYHASGGGATHIATSSGLLRNLSSSTSSILIVAGGGGGVGGWEPSKYNASIGGSGGGYMGSKGAGHGTSGQSGAVGTQDSSHSLAGFGYGASGGTGSYVYGIGGGGGGYYGGGIYDSAGGSGGSGYIGNEDLSNKVMYCYNCTESNNESTKTISTTNVSSTAISNYAKKGSGYAKITYLGEE